MNESVSRYSARSLLATAFSIAFYFLMIASVLAAMAVWSTQLIYFAKEGSWLPFDANDVLFYVTSNEWFGHPTSWLGVHKVLGFINGGWAIIIAAVCLFLLAASLADDLMKSKA